MSIRNRPFPILLQGGRDRTYDGPRALPWSLMGPHAEQALLNHGQTLERLAERGGLGPDEAVAVLEDRRWTHMSREVAGARLREVLGAASQGAEESVR